MKVGIVGATGLVGQRFAQLLEGHPYFEISELVASGDSVGKKYENATDNMVIKTLENIRKMTIKDIENELDCEVIFSALPSSVAGKLERSLVERGYFVLTNASPHRMDDDVPLVIPEVNPEHIELIERQKKEKNHHGFIVANPNCSTIQLALALKPIHEKFGLNKINIVTLQALSGAGYRGVAALEAADNVIPYIPAEEEKIEEEMLKIFGKSNGDEIENEDFTVSASCNRVNVSDGHLENVSIELDKVGRLTDIKECLNNYNGVPQDLQLPTAPEKPIIFSELKDRPQPRQELDNKDPMSVHVGRLRKDSILDYKLIILGHNTIRGAAGTSVLNAELLYSKGYI